MRTISSLFSIIILVSSLYASIPADSLKEGTCVGYVPTPADTVSDTSFHVGDTLYLGNGEISIKVPDSTKEEVVIPSVKTVVKVIIGDGFAHGKVTQIFNNPFNLPFDATYVFPLPNDGAVHGMDFRTSKGLYHAEIMKKETAQNIYDTANAQGMQASLLTQVQDGIFVQNICNIPPKDSVKITITFSTPLVYDMEKFDFNFPTTIAEDRYGDNPLDPIIEFPHERPGASLEFYVLILAPYKINNLSCPTHEVTIHPIITEQTAINYDLISQDEHFPDGVNPSLILLKSKPTIPNNDIVVRFSREEAQRDVSLLSYNDGKDGYFAMQIYPDLHDTGQAPQLIDIVFVIDRSGSMGGNPIVLAREVVHKMLDKATPDDRISLLAFNSTHTSLFPEPQPATAENLATAHSWIDQLDASGGTEMLAGVQKALQTPLTGGRVRILALITDGEIYGVDEMYAAIKNDPSSTTVFAFAVGARTNQELIDGAAEAGGGAGRHIVNFDDIAPTVEEFWKRIRIPQISNLSIDWGSPDIPTSIVCSEMSSLWYGMPIKIFGQYTSGGPRTITLSGYSNTTPVSESYNVHFVNNNKVCYFVPKIWARETIEYLMNDQIAQNDEHNKDKILELSLAHTVLCKYTAFLAVADSLMDENGNWVSAEEYYSNQPNNNNGNDTNGTTGINEITSTTKKPALRLNHLGNSIQLSLTNVPQNHINGYVTIFDLKGRIVMRWRIADLAKQNFNWTWNMNDLSGSPIAKGFYVLCVRNSFFKINKRIIIK